MSHTAGPGECPAGITSSFIDNCYFDYIARTGFEPLTDGSLCTDRPGVPDIAISHQGINPAPEDPTATSRFTLRAIDDAIAQTRSVVFVVQDMDGNGNVTVNHCRAFAAGLTIPGLHLCRGAILRSAPWRLLCGTGFQSPD